MRFALLLGLVLSACSADNPNNNNDQPDLTGVQPGADLTVVPSTDMAMNQQNQPDLSGVLPCACPTGFTCDANGQCTGGDPNSLVLDVKTVKVSGTVTVNGATPATKPACSPTTVEAVVHLVDSARGHSFDVPVLCSSTSATFDAVVFPGDYTITVTGDPDLSELPSAPFTMPKLSLAADKTGLALDVKLIAIDGTVTLNGAIPTAGQCTGDITVELTPVSGDGSFFDIHATCANPLQFSGKVYAGNYNVTILDVGDAVTSFLAYRVPTPIDATSDKHNQVFDIKTFNVGGNITINGAAPNATDCANLVGADVTFTENKTGVSATRNAACTTNVLNVPSFKLFAGEYTVTLTGNGSGGTDFGAVYLVKDKLAISTNQTTEVFNATTTVVANPMINVGGVVTLDGAAPVANNNCFSAGEVVFIDAKMHQTAFEIDCVTHDWTGQVPAGTYDILVTDNSNGSNLLQPGFPAVKAMSLQASKTNFAFDEKTVTVSGKVTLNGQDPATVGTCTAGGNQFEGTVRFTQMTGPSFGLPIPCSAGIFAWTGKVYPGTYTVSVDGVNGSSSLPDESFRLAATVDASANKSGINLDVLTTNVAGKLTLNGMQPSTTTACNANPNSHKATVELFNIDHGTTFSLPVLCSSVDFSFNGVVFPGAYRISVSGAGGFSSLPKNTYLAVPKLKL
jgi:hypothetical protein